MDDYGRFAWAKLAEDAQQVGVAVTSGQTVQLEAGYNPSATPEIWLKDGDETVYTSPAAAQGYVEVRYQRPDGAYDGWGLHLWGEAISDEVATEWAAPRMPDRVDEYGASWQVPIVDATKPLNFIVHSGDEKDTDEDRSFVPAQQPHAWLRSGELPVYATRAAALDLAVLHYRRPAGDDEGWGLHTWTGSQNPTEWTDPLQPVGQDAYGLIFEVPLTQDATELAYILHKGDEKDLPADQILDLETYGNEVWILSRVEEYLLPIPGEGGPDANLSEPRAHWINATTLLWNLSEPSAAKDYALVYAADGGLEVTDSGVTGGERIPLAYARPSLSSYDPEIAERWPHLSEYAVLRVPPEDTQAIPQALKSQLAVTESVAGQLRTATGVQIPGVLDDLYANDTELGVTWDGGVPSLRLWAPTARSVRLHLFDDPQTDPLGQTVAMERDPETGVWSASGQPGWDRRYYLYEVEVFSHETGQVERNLVTDPYSLSLATNSTKSQIVDLSDPDLAPDGWDRLRNPAPRAPEAASIYELHVRDFSITDETVPERLRGTYKAFTRYGSDGMRHLRTLADRGLSYVHLLPSFDFATIDEIDAHWLEPENAEGCADLERYPPASPRQQECVMSVADNDGYNWGYDPLHYTTPEGGYAVDPKGASRVREFREMVAGLNRSGLGTVMDVVYNHTHASGQESDRSILDRIVPGYYHRLLEDGAVATSTCCPNTATEHAMMEKLMVDSVTTWARAYKVDGFRFDLMGHHSKQNMLAVRAALDSLTLADDGVDGSEVYVYGEGWNFGEVADNARFVQATQANMAGTGIGTFNDRLRDAVRGGGPFDEDPRQQGFASGLYTDPNEAPQGTEAEQRDRLLLEMDRIRVGLAGNLADYTFVNRNGERVTGAQVPYGGAPTGYTADPQENIVYVSAHDNETLFDALAFKLPMDLPILERARMQQVALSTVAYAQGVSFFHAGTDLLRSKSFDRNSYNSGDWFNELDWSKRTNNFASGLPPAQDNEEKWPYAAPRLRNEQIDPPPWALRWSTRRFQEMLLISQTSPLFRLATGEQVQQRLHFHNTGQDQQPGLIAMTISDRDEEEQLDPLFASVTVAFNASDRTRRLRVDALAGRRLLLHPLDRFSVDRRARRARFEPATGTLVVPPRVTVAFLEPGLGVRNLTERLRERIDG